MPTLMEHDGGTDDKQAHLAMDIPRKYIALSISLRQKQPPSAES